jgi:hypothetical protein
VLFILVVVVYGGVVGSLMGVRVALFGFHAASLLITLRVLAHQRNKNGQIFCYHNI